MTDYTQAPQASQPPAAPQPQVVFVENPKNGLAVASMVLGIIAVLFVWIPFLNTISVILAVIAIGLGIPALIRANRVKKGLGLAITGLVLAVVSIIGFYVVNNAFVDAVDDAVVELEDALDASDEVAVTFGDPETVYGSTEVPVTIENTSDATGTFWVTVAAESADGTTQYATTSVIATDLKAGQTTTETAYFTSEVPADAVITVTDVM